MPAAKPSQAAVANVLAALKEAGQTAASVRVSADGGFVVDIASANVEDSQGDRSDPPRWDEAG